MPSEDTQPAMTYPTNAQYERWKTRANDLDMSVSQFMASMIEAGMKKFDAAVEPDETNRELRQQRNDLKADLDHTRERLAELEDQLHHGERATVRRFVNENPGVTFEEIVQHVMDSVPQRVNQHLNELEGDAVSVETDSYYPVDTEGDDAVGEEV